MRREAPAQPLADLGEIGSLSPPVSPHQRQRLKPHLSSESKPDQTSSAPFTDVDWINMDMLGSFICISLFYNSWQMLEVFYSANAAK